LFKQLLFKPCTLLHQSNDTTVLALLFWPEKYLLNTVMLLLFAVSTGLTHKLFWENDHKSMESSGLRYSEEDGQVIVEGLEETESYYISLQLKLNMSKATDILDETVRHRVHLLSDDASAVLLEDVTSPCIMTSHTASGKTSVVGAVFRLKYGDQLYVTTTHPENIVSDPHNNYFSIHKL
jgi:hypothetical protein